TAHRLPPRLTGLRIPRREGMKLQEITPLAVEGPSGKPPNRIVTPLTGTLTLDSLGPFAADLCTLTLPTERVVLGRGAGPGHGQVPALGRIHLLTEPVSAAVPLDA